MKVVIIRFMKEEEKELAPQNLNYLLWDVPDPRHLTKKLQSLFEDEMSVFTIITQFFYSVPLQINSCTRNN